MPPRVIAGGFQPAPEVLEWIQRQILAADGALYNEAHRHLVGADLQVMWAASGFEKQGRTVVGTAEEVTFRAGGWQKRRQEAQMEDWFGRIPKWLITLDASYCEACSDVDWCALVEHELSHVGHKADPFGQPMFSRSTGKPVLYLRGHDFEQFLGVVERYGVGGEDSPLARAVAAANRGPSIGRAAIGAACGTCMLRAA